MKAKEMFEKLHFKLVDETEDYIVYMRSKPYDSGSDFIEFYKDVQMVQTLYASVDTVDPIYLSFEEITAIKKQMSELNWKNEWEEL